MTDLVTLTPYKKAESKKDIIIRKQKKQIMELKQQIEEMINEIDKTMCLSNMREREIYDIQEIFRKYNFRRDSNNKWEMKENE